jgi:type VI secretion system protein ImpI
VSVLLTLVQAPHPQAVRQMRLEDGEIVIGRSADADWRIDDPDQFVSRAHCTVTGQGGSFMVTDTSSGGLFVDEARAPLGPGRSLPLRDGMRLRLGDYVVRVEMRATERPAERPAPPDYDTDGFFSAPAAATPRPERPRDLPDPFDRPSSFVPPVDTSPPERRRPPEFDDPFTLDPGPERRRERPPPADFWTEPTPEPDRPPPRAADFDWGPSEPAPQARPANGSARPAPDDWAARVPEASASPAPCGGGDASLGAFLRGLGIDPADAPEGDPAARLEAFGREYRMMAEGLMHLLRQRAEEKGSARIAQTVVGAADVNPLKFMPTVEDALAVMVAARGGGFVDADAAIAAAVRDLAMHHAATWRGIQAALRRMVDRFDPKALEKELAEVGTLEKLLAGGRRAKLWELYEKRYREIAKSAETRFLGEVGADFRDAYEKEE